ncbi:MAG: DUF4167 domain-containing protein [Candidatus Puniceispirillaceae bacterium]
MRQNQNAKRSRGRGRRSGNSGQSNFNRNTTFESNGPEGRLRGNAQQLYEKYTSLANDAQSAGERVLFEANSQFADHYYRIHQSILANAEQRRQNDERGQHKKQPPKSEADDKVTGHDGEELKAEEASIQPDLLSDAAEQTVSPSHDDSAEQAEENSSAENSSVTDADDKAVEEVAAAS